jgi:hypothetical protein
VLLAVFDQRPLPINVDERTRVFLPGSQYRTFANTLEETITIPAARDNLPRIRAARPQMTFFDGLGADADVRPAGAAMNPVITVVSTVRIDYQSPATKSVSRDR